MTKRPCIELSHLIGIFLITKKIGNFVFRFCGYFSLRNQILHPLCHFEACQNVKL